MKLNVCLGCHIRQRESLATKKTKVREKKRVLRSFEKTDCKGGQTAQLGVVKRKA